MYIIKDIKGVVVNSSDDKELLENTLVFMPDCTLEETEEDWQLIDGIYRLGGKTVEEQNEEIRQTRQQAYIEISDPLKNDYDEALARNDSSSEAKKQLWLESKDKIRAENPYIEEQKPLDKEENVAII